MTNAVISLMQRLYFDEGSARAVLIRIGYPPARIPVFRAADTFWPEIVLRLNDTVLDGTQKLLAAAVADNPGSQDARALLARTERAGGGPTRPVARGIPSGSCACLPTPFPSPESVLTTRCACLARSPSKVASTYGPARRPGDGHH